MRNPMDVIGAAARSDDAARYGVGLTVLKALRDEYGVAPNPNRIGFAIPVPDCADAGLEPITPHQARHTYASMMIEARVDYKMLSEVLGHDSIATTLDVYGHLMPRTYDAMRSAVESLLSADSTRTATR